MRAKKTASHIRQEQIVEAALDIIATEGLHALSIAGIAKRVGIVSSALYRHYNGKEEVLDAVLVFIRKRLMSNVDHVVKETRDPLQRLKRILMRHARMLDENRAIPHVVFSDWIYTGHPERKAKVADIITGYLGIIREIIKEGKNDGTIRPDTDTEAASVMFLGMILPAAVLSNVSEGRFDMVKHAENAWPIFVRCIAKI